MTTPESTEPRRWWLAWGVFAAIVYAPLLATAPGQVAADSKSALYVDPGRLLGRAVSMWDPSVALGTVPHQQIGFLWPMGPFFWVFDLVGLPVWVAQRLWLGSILAAAAGGVLFLARTWRWRLPAAAAAAFAYGLSPFVLTLGARISVLLLPFAALPWLLALTVRALHHRGWRHPALFALVLTTAGSVNATSILLIGLGPALWVLYAVFVADEVSRPRAVNTLGKIAAVSVPLNLWWILGLSVQATNGLDVLAYTESAETVASASTAPEVLRGLGYWFFYGGDRLGPWIEPATDYTQRLWLLALTYGIPVVGLLALGVVRWRHRKFLVGLVVLGVVVAVGAHPWHEPSSIGAIVKAFLNTDAGLAMRSLPRAVPLVALATALGLGSLVGAAAEQVPRRGVLGAVAVAVCAVAALPPLWTRSMVPDNLRRPEALPDHWLAAAEALDNGDEGRILELPGSDFASYRWGNTVDSVLPALVDRPSVARELVPAGSAASAQLVGALDRRVQEATLDSAALAPIARIMGVDTVLARHDLQYERYFTPRPRSLGALLLAEPRLVPGARFGSGFVNVPDPRAPLVDELHLARDAALPDPAALELYAVPGTPSLLRAHPTDAVILLAGDADGLVDTAAAGLLRGDELIRYTAELTDDQDFVVTELRDERALVVTDTNRRRGERWHTVRHTTGYTEQVDGGLLATDRSDNRLGVLPRDAGSATVAEHRGVSVRATGYGNPITYTPEERPVLAADGDVTTAWRVAGFDDAVGHRIELRAPAPVRADRVRLTQALTGEVNRWITRVELRFDGRDARRVDLDARSRTENGQVIEFPFRTFETLSVEIIADTAGRRPGYGGLTSVGFAEITVPGLRADEVIRMPDDVLTAGGFRTLRYPLAIVQTRLWSDPTETTRRDEERAIDRALRLPVARAYRLTGTARVSARAPDHLLERLLRGPSPVTVTATSRLPGGLGHLPGNVLDGDPATVWTSAFGAGVSHALSIRTDTPVTVDGFEILTLEDDSHSRPTAVRVFADDRPLGAFPLAAGAGDDRLVRSPIALPEPITFHQLRIEFDPVVARRTIDWYSQQPERLPVAVAEITLGELRTPPIPDDLDSGCRTDLLRIDDDPVAIRITGTRTAALAGRPLEVHDCGSSHVAIGPGDHRFRAETGAATGWNLDQLVWRSAGGGGAGPALGPLLNPVGGPQPTVAATDTAATRRTLTVDGARPGEPFWLIFAESHNPGWRLTVDGAEVTGPHLVNGYANGFLVTPQQAALTGELRFVPQNRVEVGYVISLLALLAAVAMALTPATELRPLPIPRQEPLRRLRAFTWEGALPSPRAAQVVGLACGVASAIVANLAVGVAVGLLTVVAARRESWRIWFTALPAGLLTIAGAYVVIVQYRNGIEPGLHWPADTGRLHPLGLTAVLLLTVDVAIDELWRRGSEYR